MAQTGARRRAGITQRPVAADPNAAAVAAVTAGAERASQERAVRRRRTAPLLVDPVATIQVNGLPTTTRTPHGSGNGVAGPARGSRQGSRQVVDGISGSVAARRPVGKTTGSKGSTAKPKGSTAKPKGPSGSSRPRVQVRPVARAAGQVEGVARWERLIAVDSVAEEAGEELVNGLCSGTRAASEVEERIADILQLLRHRLTGDYEVDEFGFDPELTDRVLFALLRPLYRRWFRVEVSGIENVPGSGGALVVANHSGTIALDALITALAVHDEHPAHRFLRTLGADLVFQTPFIGELARKGGATLAANADAERLLGTGQLVGVWPEGFKGIGKPFSERYKLQRFGRGGFVSAALRTRTPIVPCSIVGAEETYPIIGNLPTLARLLGLPYLPVTPTWPWLGPLGMIPLPSKWLIEFGPPVTTDELGIGAADDPMLVFDLTDQIRQTIQQTLYSLLIQRRSVFF